MSKIDKLAQFAQNIVNLNILDLNDFPRACARNRAENKRGLEIENWLHLALSNIEVLAVQLRHYQNEEAAEAALEKAHWAATQAREAFEYYVQRNEVTASPMHRVSFPNGEVAAWLAGDWELAKYFATITLRDDLFFTHGEGDFGSVHEIIAYMFSAVTIDNSDRFELWHARFQEEISLVKGTDSFWRTYFIYPSLMRAILKLDSSGFMELLSEADRLFTLRGKDKAMDSLSTIEGPPGFNPLMIDYRAAALAQLAMHRGMKVDFESAALPVSTINKWRKN